MFYCSKCAINLLQQGFPIEEIKNEQHLIPSAALLRGQQVAKLELRLRALEERTRSEAELNERKDDLELLQEEIFNCNKKFGEVFEKLEAIRKDHINSLNNTYARVSQYLFRSNLRNRLVVRDLQTCWLIWVICSVKLRITAILTDLPPCAKMNFSF